MVRINPNRYKVALTKPAFRTFFSTIGPNKAAPTPRKKIANEKIHSTSDFEHPICCTIANLNKLQQYIVPIDQCINKDGIAPFKIFSNIIDLST